MANEGDYPKIAGDVGYPNDLNTAYYEGALRSGTVSFSGIIITTTAVLILGSASNRFSYYIQNLGSNTLTLGQSGVTGSAGLKVLAGESYYSRGDKTAVYGISPSGQVDVRYWEI